MTAQEARLKANQNGGGVHGPAFKPLQTWKGLRKKAKVQTGPGKSGRPGVCPVKTGVFSRR
jgi:hypothetical protein